jgi:hypothetical protein
MGWGVEEVHNTLYIYDIPKAKRTRSKAAADGTPELAEKVALHTS